MGPCPHPIIKAKVKVFLQCLLFLKSLRSSGCGDHGSSRRGKSSGGREPFPPLGRREIRSSLLLLVFHLCPVRSRMTNRPQLYLATQNLWKWQSGSWWQDGFWSCLQTECERSDWFSMSAKGTGGTIEQVICMCSSCTDEVVFLEWFCSALKIWYVF